MTSSTPRPPRTPPATARATQRTTSRTRTTKKRAVVPAPAIGRIPVITVGPVVEGGRWPARAVVGEAVEITARVFREGHDAVAATAVLVGPDGMDRASVRMDVVVAGLDTYRTDLAPDAQGRWGFRVEGWSDPYATWRHDASIKVEAGVDVELMLAEGAALLERAAEREGLPPEVSGPLREAVVGVRDARRRPPLARLAAALAPEVAAALAAAPLREHVTASATFPLVVQRERALTGAWYEMFPRSEGASYDAATGAWRSGTLRTAAERLPAIADMGFDVVYLTPVHPIGGRMSEIATAIAAAIEEQAAATREIASSVTQAAQGTGEVSSNIAGVSTAVHETGDAAGRVHGTSQELAAEAERLRHEVGTFIATVRAA